MTTKVRVLVDICNGYINNVYLLDPLPAGLELIPVIISDAEFDVVAEQTETVPEYFDLPDPAQPGRPYQMYVARADVEPGTSPDCGELLRALAEYQARCRRMGQAEEADLLDQPPTTETKE